MLVPASRCASRAVTVGQRLSRSSVRGLAAASGGGDDGDDKKMPLGLSKVFKITSKPDNLIATDRDRKLHKGELPDFLPPDMKKDLDKLGVDAIGDFDELEEANLDGYNDLGLVPPEGTGTFSSPILIPSRRASRAVGYVDPTSHAPFFFNIYNDDNTYYIKDLGLFFKMLHIEEDVPDQAGVGISH